MKKGLYSYRIQGKTYWTPNASFALIKNRQATTL